MHHHLHFFFLPMSLLITIGSQLYSVDKLKAMLPVFATTKVDTSQLDMKDAVTCSDIRTALVISHEGKLKLLLSPGKLEGTIEAKLATKYSIKPASASAVYESTDFKNRPTAPYRSGHKRTGTRTA